METREYGKAMVNKDINFFQTKDQMPIATAYVDNSEMGYEVGQIKKGFKLILIRKYVYGYVYIWRNQNEEIRNT